MQLFINTSRWLAIITYLAGMVYILRWSWMPIIAAYGWTSSLLHLVGFAFWGAFMGALLAYLFAWRSPMATRKENYNV